MLLCDSCGNTHLCTPAWREEDEEPKGISWACPLITVTVRPTGIGAVSPLEGQRKPRAMRSLVMVK